MAEKSCRRAGDLLLSADVFRPMGWKNEVTPAPKIYSVHQRETEPATRDLECANGLRVSHLRPAIFDIALHLDSLQANQKRTISLP